MKSLQILCRAFAILAIVSVAGIADTTKTIALPTKALAKATAAKAIDTTKAKAAAVAAKAVDTAKAVVHHAVDPKPAAKAAEPAKPVEVAKPAEAPKATEAPKAKPAKSADTTKAKKARNSTKAKAAEPKADTAKAAASVSGGKSCDEVKSSIEEKVRAKGNKSYALEVVAAADVKDQKVVGSCAGGSKKIVKAK